MYYKLHKPQEYIKFRWYVDFKKSSKEILKPWWQEPSKFGKKPDGIYKTKMLRRVYQYLMEMSYRIYGQENLEFFEEKQFYMVYPYDFEGIIFNLADLIAISL